MSENVVIDTEMDGAKGGKRDSTEAISNDSPIVATGMHFAARLPHAREIPIFTDRFHRWISEKTVCHHRGYRDQVPSAQNRQTEASRMWNLRAILCTP